MVSGLQTLSQRMVPSTTHKPAKDYKLKKFTITKKQIINALTTEPIGAEVGVYASATPFGKTVKLSAVGAVLRSLALTHKSAKSIYSLSRDAFNTVARHNAAVVESLGQLERDYSAFRMTTIRTPKLRTALTNLVQSTFPSKIEVALWNPADEATVSLSQPVA